MKVRLTKPAEADLDEIVSWIAGDDPARADSFGAELWERCQSLASRPQRFPLALHASGFDVRKLVHRDYLIFYLVLDDRVEVLRIVHGSRNWGALLGSNE
ncbi:MAG: type II toxin-antitoxin system RelE/ParE family toxin [Allosphingosinicella sp.]